MPEFVEIATNGYVKVTVRMAWLIWLGRDGLLRWKIVLVINYHSRLELPEEGAIELNMTNKTPTEEAEMIANEVMAEVSLLQLARQQRDELVVKLVGLFGWDGDPSYLHATMHVENAVRNLRADLVVEKREVERLRRENADIVHRAELAEIEADDRGREVERLSEAYRVESIAAHDAQVQRDYLLEWREGVRGSLLIANAPKTNGHTEEAYSSHKARYLESAAHQSAYAEGADEVATVVLAIKGQNHE